MGIEAEFLSITSSRFARAFERMEGALRQLDDGQIWLRPSSHSNSVGIIVQHLAGNLNQWLCAAIGGRTYHRNRSEEFNDTRQPAKGEVLLTLSELNSTIQGIITRIPPETLLSPRRIQGFDETVLSALLASLTHLELHTGQISFITKFILNEKFQESWKPATAEQGKRE